MYKEERDVLEMTKIDECRKEKISSPLENITEKTVAILSD